jgi:hypothetical protein
MQRQYQIKSYLYHDTFTARDYFMILGLEASSSLLYDVKANALNLLI